jgi:hypothetical protein
MRRSTHPRPQRGRLLRELWPDRNPLRRTSDRVAAAIVAGALAAFLVGAPLLALFASRWAGAAALQVGRAQQSSWRQVPAVLLASAGPAAGIGVGGVMRPEAPARWTAPDWQVRTGLLPVPASAQAGGTVRVWVDAAGRPTGPPLRHEQAIGQALLAAVAAPLGLGAVLLATAALAIRAVNRHRLAAWAADWQATAPRWTSPR